MADIVFVGQFVAAKVGKVGLSVLVDVDRYTISDGSRTALVTAGSATEGRRGLYHYCLASADLSLYQYVATFITSDATVDQQEIAAIGLVVPDALVSSRLAPATAGRTLEVAATGEASANVTSLKGTLLTETSAGRLAAALSHLLDVETPALTVASVNQTGDAYSKIAALNDLDAAEVQAAAAAALAAVNLDHLAGTASGIPDIPSGTFLDLVMRDGTASYDRTTDSLQAIRDRGDAAWTAAVSGLYSETITIDDGANPLDGVLVQMATDAGFTNVIRSGYTNTLGQWIFQVDAAGTYYGRAEISDFNVQTFTVVIA